MAIRELAASKMSKGTKGRFTIRTAGFLFLLSAVFEIVSIRSEVPLFGAIRGGAVAAVCHLVFAALFGAMGYGLWTARRWAPRAVLGGTVVYTLDKAIFLLDRDFLETYLLDRLGPYQDILELIDMREIMSAIDILTLTILGCWWGFALYIYMRRAYFEPDAATGEKPQ
jgi:hypothetical protein